MRKGTLAVAFLPLLLMRLAFPPSFGGATDGRAWAKEPTAGCASAESLIERLRNSLVLAAVHRTRGSSMAAYEVLYTNAVAFAKDSAQAGCGALTPLIERAIARAQAAPQALDASLELDRGIAAVMSAAMTGRLPPNGIAAKLLDVTESVEYGDDCPDVFRLRLRLGERSGQRPNDDDEKLASRVAEVIADLHRSPRCTRLRRLLEASSTSALPHAVDSLRLDEADDVIITENPLSRCPELPLVIERLSAAIVKGARLFNRGDHEGCLNLYEQTTRALLEKVIPEGRCPGVKAELTTAAAEAGRAATPGAAAWSLRRGFDRIADSVGATK